MAVTLSGNNVKRTSRDDTDFVTKEKRITMENNRLSAREWIERIVVALLFIAIGGAIMIVFKPWGRLFLVARFGDPLGNVYDYLGRVGLSALLLLVAVVLRRSKQLEKYWQIFFAFFILLVALTISLVFGSFLFDSLGVKDSVPVGWALPKLNETILIVLVVILFTRLLGGSLGSIYIQKGNLKLGLIIGIVTFLLAAAGSIPMANLLFGGNNLTLARIIPWIPWLLVTVLANGALEEILFRGLFLRKLEPFVGKFLSNFLIAIVFTVLHQGSSYTSDQYIFLAVLFPLALAWGYITQKTDSAWASILFHAGMDIPIFLGIFSNLK
jgi:membrane protease YdiL (CAAX protease family)